MAFYSESKDINKQRLEVLKSMGGKKNMAIADVFSDSINQRERSALDLYDGKITWGEFNKARKQMNENYERRRKEIESRSN
jgi:hypothetical protein